MKFVKFSEPTSEAASLVHHKLLMQYQLARSWFFTTFVAVRL
jgi:hypothetical protein